MRKKQTAVFCRGCFEARQLAIQRVAGMTTAGPLLCVNNITVPVSLVDDFMSGLGFAGGFILGGCLIPQIVQSVRSKSTADLAYGWQITYFVGLALIVSYAMYYGLWPIWAPGVFELASIGVLLLLKMKYDGCGRDAWVAKPTTAHAADTKLTGEGKSSHRPTTLAMVVVEPSSMVARTKSDLLDDKDRVFDD